MTRVFHPADSTGRVAATPLRRLLAAAALAAVLGATPAAAEGFASPAGPVILTLGGKIAATNSEGTLALDQALLETLPQHEFATSTIWTEGVATFRGVLLRDLLRATGATGTTVTLTALNDYSITLPVAEATETAPLLAYLMNGQPMSVRDKGPVWLIYPYDADADFRTEQTYARSIWQLDRIEVGD
jgi:hypothetical protein